MEKKKVSAKKAVTDIRSGMSDAALMSKYLLSNAGLQSLFDKLVTAGYIDLAEMLERTAAFLGTVDISESFPAEAVKAEDGRQPLQTRASTRVNAQEAARDIRSGMDDFALMHKYQISSKGLSSLFKKLTEVGLIKQIDLDRRNVGFEHTVALTEDMLSLSSALKALGLHRPAVATDKSPHRPALATDEMPMAPQRTEPLLPVEVKVESIALPDEQPYMKPRRVEPDSRSFERGRWCDNPAVVIILLIALFPLGLYACYRNSSLSAGVKAFAIVTCLLLIAGCLIVISLLPNSLFPRFL